MRFTPLLALSAAVATAHASYMGFNYASTFTDGSAKQQSDFEAEFKAAQSLAGTNGKFSSARLYTGVQAGTTNSPISAIPAAISTKTTLLLGLWASAGQANMDNEIAALKAAISKYGSDFTDLIAGISVGSEDLYRNSATGIENDSLVGANPADIVNYIKQVRSAIAGTAASGAKVGHVDTWDAWTNSSNADVASNCDWLGMDTYPYFQFTQANGIENSKDLFYAALSATSGVAGGKEVWVTETGWPVSGKQEGAGVASVANAEKYWQETGCSLFGQTNVWWYILDDSLPATPNPSFGIVTSLTGSPLYDLTCSASASSSSSSSSSSASSTSSASSASSSASSASSTGTSSTGSSSTGGSSSGGSGATTATSGSSSTGSSSTGSSSTGSSSATTDGSSSTGSSGSPGSNSASSGESSTVPSIAPSSSATYTGSASGVQAAGFVAGVGAFAALFL